MWVSGGRRGGLVGVLYESCCCGILVNCSLSLSVSSRPVDIAYLTFVRTASMFGAHPSGSGTAFPPK